MRKKAFLFLGKADAMIKLRESLAEAAALAAPAWGQCKVGAHGWVTVQWGDDQPPPLHVFARWADESYRLLAPKQLVAALPAAGGVIAPPADRRGASRRGDRSN